VTHAIKGNFTTYSGERCIYHVPGGAFYGKTNPERCYATEAEARQDGCRRSKR
jgi:competence protein ComEC